MHFINPSSAHVSIEWASVVANKFGHGSAGSDALLKSNQGSARPKSATRDQPTEINTTAARVIILELLARALLAAAAVNERRTKWPFASPYTGAFRLNIAGELCWRYFCSCGSNFNYSSAHQLYCTLWRTPKQKVSDSVCAHTHRAVC